MVYIIIHLWHIHRKVGYVRSWHQLGCYPNQLMGLVGFSTNLFFGVNEKSMIAFETI